jgi:predicted transposase YdaD
MQEYDITLKLLLQTAASVTIRELTGTAIKTWLNVELPEVRNLRLDLLGETEEGRLIHLELQSSNDAAMAVRMAEYSLSVFRQFGEFPRQVVLYVGEAPPRMQEELRAEDVLFRYRLIDVRELDGERLLASGELGDNVIAILARLRDRRDAVWQVLSRITALPVSERETALRQLLILAGLRRLEQTVEAEARTMPVFIDLMENQVLGREYKKGLEEGLEKGREEGLEKGLEKGLERGLERGLEKGKQAGGMMVLRRLIEKRFGRIPAWADERLASRSARDLEDLGVRLLDAQSLEELLG